MYVLLFLFLWSTVDIIFCITFSLLVHATCYWPEVCLLIIFIFLGKLWKGFHTKQRRITIEESSQSWVPQNAKKTVQSVPNYAQ